MLAIGMLDQLFVIVLTLTGGLDKIRYDATDDIVFLSGGIHISPRPFNEAGFVALVTRSCDLVVEASPQYRRPTRTFPPGHFPK